MKMINKLALVATFAMGMVLNANALLLTPATATWQGSVPENPKADDIELITGTAAELTLAVKDGGPEGPFVTSYQITYANDFEDATITYTGGPAITGNPIYMLVKDGNHDPIWYLFDISSWNGIETIELNDFWPDGGAISHISIFNGASTSVPDAGSSMALLGIALTGIGFLRRKLA